MFKWVGFLSLLLVGLLPANNISIKTIDGGDGVVAGVVPTIHLYKNKVFILYGNETTNKTNLIQKKSDGNFETIHTIDGTANASNFNIDKNGNLHICYLYDDAIYYDTNKTGEWKTKRIDDAYSSTWTRIGCDVDTYGNVYMSYDFANDKDNELHFATNKSGNFEIEKVNTKGTQYSDMAIGDNRPYLSYSDFSQVYFSYKYNDVWKSVAIGGWTDNSISYAVNALLVAYVEQGTLKFAKIPLPQNMDNNITPDEVSKYTIDYSCDASLPDIAMGKKKIDVAYLCDKDGKKYVKVSSLEGDSIIVDEITPSEDYWHGEYGVSIAFDENDNWHIAYYDVKNKDLKYATDANETTKNDQKNDTADSNITNQKFITLNIHKGWQNLGFSNDMNVNVLDNSCIDFVWKYDISKQDNPKWKLYVTNGKSYDIPSNIEKLYFLKSGEGYWIRGNKDCTIKIPVSSNQNLKSKLISYQDIVNKKMELLNRNKNGDVDIWIEFTFNKDNTFYGNYNDNITDQYATTEEIRDSGIKISGTWDIVDSKIYLYMKNKTIILTPISLNIENYIGFETYEGKKYTKQIFTIQNFYQPK